MNSIFNAHCQRFLNQEASDPRSVEPHDESEPFRCVCFMAYTNLINLFGMKQSGQHWRQRLSHISVHTFTVVSRLFSPFQKTQINSSFRWWPTNTIPRISGRRIIDATSSHFKPYLSCQVRAVAIGVHGGLWRAHNFGEDPA